jgi:hypothetical protein
MMSAMATHNISDASAFMQSLSSLPFTPPGMACRQGGTCSGNLTMPDGEVFACADGATNEECLQDYFDNHHAFITCDPSDADCFVDVPNNNGNVTGELAPVAPTRERRLISRSLIEKHQEQRLVTCKAEDRMCNKFMNKLRLQASRLQCCCAGRA